MFKIWLWYAYITSAYKSCQCPSSCWGTRRLLEVIGRTYSQLETGFDWIVVTISSPSFSQQLACFILSVGLVWIIRRDAAEIFPFSGARLLSAEWNGIVVLVTHWHPLENLRSHNSIIFTPRPATPPPTDIEMSRSSGGGGGGGLFNAGNHSHARNIAAFVIGIRTKGISSFTSE